MTDPTEIQVLLKRAHIKQRVIAKATKHSEALVSQVIYGRRDSPKIKKWIKTRLKKCGFAVEDLWPSGSGDRKAA